MAVTAIRLGSAPIAFDWTHILRKRSPDVELFQETWEKLKGRFLSNEIGFYHCPTDPKLSQIEESQKLATQILKRECFTDCLFLGIGGSALGPISLLEALREKCTTGIRFHFMENPDPLDWKTTLKGLKPDSTLVCVVTKSGTTFETMA